jgi:hypothetical protein
MLYFPLSSLPLRSFSVFMMQVGFSMVSTKLIGRAHLDFFSLLLTPSLTLSSSFLQFVAGVVR